MRIFHTARSRLYRGRFLQPNTHFRFFGFRDFVKEVAWKYLQKRMGLALKGCLKIGGAGKRGSQENGGGGKKSGGKKKVIVSFLIWFATARTFLPAFFFPPTVLLPLLFLPHHLFFARFLFYRHYFFVTSFLLPVFSGKVFLEATATAATKFF